MTMNSPIKVGKTNELMLEREQARPTHVVSQTHVARDWHRLHSGPDDINRSLGLESCSQCVGKAAEVAAV